MVKFKLGETEIDYYDFARHHKRLSVHIGRKHEDGSFTDLINDDTFRKDVEANQDKVFTRMGKTYVNDTFQSVEDTYVWLENAEYVDAEFEYYSTGAMNTKQTTHVRLKFQFECGKAFLDYKYDTSGTYASTFHDIMGSGIGYIIDEILDDEPTLKDDGICRKNDAEILMIITDEAGQPVDCEMSMWEIKAAFIGAEIYKFEQEIVDDKEALEGEE